MTSKTEPGGAGDARQAAAARREWMSVAATGIAATCASGAAYLLDLAPGSPGRFDGPARAAGNGRVPDVPLLTHEGRRVRFYSDLVKGRTVFVSMMYAQCGDRCPPMTASLRRVQLALGDRVGRDVFMYSVTLLPEHDRPADLRAYMAMHEVGPGWTFLTGEKADVERLRLAMGFFDPDPAVDADLGQHIGMVRIGNDAVDRWCMATILNDTDLILEGLMAVDPVSRARGRTWAVRA